MLSVPDKERPKYSTDLSESVNDPHLASVRADLALARKLTDQLVESSPVAAGNMLKVVARLARQVREAEERTGVYVHRDEVLAMLDRIAEHIATVLHDEPQTVDLLVDGIRDAIRRR